MESKSTFPLYSMRPQTLGPLPPPLPGPALRLIPATPVVGEQESNLCIGMSPRKRAMMAKQEDAKLIVGAKKDVGNNNSPRTMKTPLVSRSNTQTSETCSGAASDSTKATTSAGADSSRKEWGRSPSVRSVGGWRPKAMPGLRRSNSDKTPSKKKSVKVIRKMKSVNKPDSVKSGEPSLKGSSSFHKSSKSSKSNSFYRVIDKLRRGFVRRSSTQPSGQADFLDSISKMSDSRIVENWLLSLDEEAAAPVEVVEVPDKLLRVSESSSNSHRGGVTPTNELFEQDRKANGSEPERVLFQLAASSEDDESVMGEDQMRCQRPSSAPPRQTGLMRQMSECSEYTTDTHDTGETAQVTARNTITNTDASFTWAGNEIRKGKDPTTETFFRSDNQNAVVDAILKPACSISEDGELDDLEVAAINLESIELEMGGQLTSRSSDVKLSSRSSEVTVYTGCSSQRSQPMDTSRKGRVRRGSFGSDCQGTSCAWG